MAGTNPNDLAMIGWNRDADGIVTLTMDDPGQRVNTMNAAFQDSLGPVSTGSTPSRTRSPGSS